MNSKQVMTTPIGALVDQCVGCGCDLDIGNTYELYLQSKGLCVGCHNERMQHHAILEGAINAGTATEAGR